MENHKDVLKLQNMLCFPLYAVSKEIIKRYRPYLEELDLTYTQYITMLLLWEKKKISVKEMGKRLFLDSGTLTPVLKSLQAKGYITKKRSTEDERMIITELTEKGEALREKAIEVPYEMSGFVKLEKSETKQLYSLLYKMLCSFDENK